MATIVLTALGTMIGGPLGGAVGSLIGRQVDGAVFGSKGREGPRLKELAVTTSSYGQPIARHYGSVRVPGTIIWATDLKETKEKSGGGKGQPSTTTYAYSVSFAVALSSRPIDGLGRIWADGNLLRGAAGDLKSAGALRIHNGHGDQETDALLASALGEQSPAHRGCAYVVFEDLALADFGNRIPALTFEVFAGEGCDLLPGLLGDAEAVDRSAKLTELEGYSHDGGSAAAVLAQLARLKPIAPVYRRGSVGVAAIGMPESVQYLPEPARWSEGEFGREDGTARTRKARPQASITALRYYDFDRDYQPGLQRAAGGEAAARGATEEFPGVLAAVAARSLLRDVGTREKLQQETISWRMAQLDPAMVPGAIVRVPGRPGTWLIAEWEWREAGVELQLVRHLEPLQSAAAPADPGDGWRPRDRIVGATSLRVFELPWDGIGSSEAVRTYAAVAAPAGPWPGAALFARHATALEPIGSTGAARATTGTLLEPLESSSAVRFDPLARVRVQLVDEEAELSASDPAGLARGANRLLVGDEVLQFLRAEPRGGGVWEVTGLLRGRGGTEHVAAVGHRAGTALTLLDDDLVLLNSDTTIMSGADGFAAIGLGDESPVLAEIESAGASRRPLAPCHGSIRVNPDGSARLSWVRRARGGWLWPDEVDLPLVEQEERYEIGIGQPNSPLWMSSVSASEHIIEAADYAGILGGFGGEILWVRQCGTFGKSVPLALATIR